MANPIVIPFVAEHLLVLAPRDLFDDTLISEAWRKEREGPAFTAWHDDKPIACAGVMILRPGVGYAWTVLGHDFHKHRIYCTRTIRNALRDIIKGCNLHRVEANVLEDQHAYRKWIELFGFEPEGVAHDYTSDRRNIVRYEWIRYKLRVQAVGDTPDTRQFVAMIGDEKVGYAAHTYTPKERYAYGLQMDVDVRYRGRGVGLALHRARLDAARQDGAPFFVGQSSNPAMIHILEKCGARRCVNELGVTYVVKL
jgi:RimJ/RimL family protein N-acetyltransferase